MGTFRLVFDDAAGTAEFVNVPESTEPAYADGDLVLWSNHLGTEFAAHVTTVFPDCLEITLDGDFTWNRAYKVQLVHADELTRRPPGDEDTEDEKPVPPGHVRLGASDYSVEFLILTGSAPTETVLALDAADRLGYLAYCDEWTDGAEPLPEVFQHAADALLAAGQLPRFTTQETPR